MSKVSCYVDLDDIDLDELIIGLTRRLDFVDLGNYQREIKKLKTVLQIEPGFKRDSIEDDMKIEQMIKVMEKYTLKEIETALPV